MRILRDLRLAAGKTQEELAALCGHAAQRISDWETGRRSIPPAAIPLLIRALDCRRELEGLPFPIPAKLRRFVGVPGSAEVQIDDAPSWASVSRHGHAGARARLSDASLPPYSFRRLIRVDVNCEEFVWHTLCEAGAQYCTISPALLGFPHHFLVDPSGAGLGVRSKGALFLDYGKWDATIIPQVSMQVRNEILRADALVALDITRGGPWVIIEFDGAAHSGRQEWDKIRDSRLIPKVLRFANSCVLAPGFPETLKHAFAQELGRRARRSS